MSNYYSEDLPGYTCIDFPGHNARRVIEFLRANFGQNNIHEPFNQRRWLTYGPGEYIFFRDRNDALIFKLKWTK